MHGMDGQLASVKGYQALIAVYSVYRHRITYVWFRSLALVAQFQPPATIMNGLDCLVQWGVHASESPPTMAQ